MYQRPDLYLKRIFDNVDRDRSGSIDAQELQAALSNGTFLPFNPETVISLIGMFDRNNSGKIGFNEFKDLWRYVTDWERVFRSFDRDNSGNIDFNELKQALASFGYRLSDFTISNILRRFDKHGDGTLYFDDFIQCLVVLHNITAEFSQIDTNRDGRIYIHYEQLLNMFVNTKV
ncbi:programmed cell death protein 6-like [Artemia franciscana]|uniref:EF-hand domain-containing protein n=1 Tax=Artemia franciscana TaxID=6661 RepID=A0AA88LIF2_ARTSF|nr:hypothetical protein QYM36_003222 [Artemia franciscana]